PVPRGPTRTRVAIRCVPSSWRTRWLRYPRSLRLRRNLSRSSGLLPIGLHHDLGGDVHALAVASLDLDGHGRLLHGGDLARHDHRVAGESRNTESERGLPD